MLCLCRTALCALCGAALALCVVRCSAMCRALHCAVLCSALHLFVLCRIVPRALCRTALHCVAVHCAGCAAPHCAVLRTKLCVPCCSAPCGALHCTACASPHRTLCAVLHCMTPCGSAFGAAPPQCASRLTLNSFPTCPDWLRYHSAGGTLCVLRLTALRVLRRAALCAPCCAAARGAVLL